MCTITAGNRSLVEIEYSICRIADPENAYFQADSLRCDKGEWLVTEAQMVPRKKLDLSNNNISHAYWNAGSLDHLLLHAHVTQ